MTWLEAHITGLAWCFAAWALLIAVVGGALLRRWHRHEDHDAAETERVMKALKADHSHLHEQDAL
jgi:uncharacterized membrane-anchored protein YhcB (DUF1043 family)